MGAWIEMSVALLKYPSTASHPTMGAWIEIIRSLEMSKYSSSHPTMGAWIEIETERAEAETARGRTPRWVRGLKLCGKSLLLISVSVAPHDGCVD